MKKSGRYQTAIRVTAITSTTNTLLALLKIAVGYWGHSQALIADGIHSLSDLITDLLVLIAAYVGDRLPDREHPYGHRRIETIAAIIISTLLILVALGIASDTIKHILHYTLKKPSFLVLVIAIVSAVAN